MKDRDSKTGHGTHQVPKSIRERATDPNVELGVERRRLPRRARKSHPLGDGETAENHEPKTHPPPTPSGSGSVFRPRSYPTQCHDHREGNERRRFREQRQRKQDNRPSGAARMRQERPDAENHRRRRLQLGNPGHGFDIAWMNEKEETREKSGDRRDPASHEKEYQQPRSEGVNDDVDDVVPLNAFAEQLPLCGVQEEMHRGVVFHQPGHDAGGIEDRHQVCAGWVMNEGVVLHVMGVVGNELSLERGRVDDEGQAQKRHHRRDREPPGWVPPGDRPAVFNGGLRGIVLRTGALGPALSLRQLRASGGAGQR